MHPPALPTETMMAVVTPFFSEPPELLAPKETTSGMRGYPPAAARKSPTYWTPGVPVQMRRMNPRAPVRELMMMKGARICFLSLSQPARTVVKAART